MMAVLKKAGIVGVMVLAFFVYFLTESLLRQAAVSNINPQSVSMDSLLSRLPQSMRDAAGYKIETTRLKNAVKASKSDGEKAASISNLADYTRDQAERESLYAGVLKSYPKLPETYRAYCFFLLNPDTKIQLTAKDYHGYLACIDQMNRFNVWVAGLNKLAQRRATADEMVDFLLPLFDERPAYRDYSRLFVELSKLAEKAKRSDVVAKADVFVESCKRLPSMDEELKAKTDALKAEKSKSARAKK